MWFFTFFIRVIKNIYFRSFSNCDRVWTNLSCAGWFQGSFIDAKICYKNIRQPRICSYLALSLPKHEIDIKLNFEQIYNIRDIFLSCLPLGCDPKDSIIDSYFNIGNVIFIHYNTSGIADYATVQSPRDGHRYIIDLVDFKLIKNLILSCYRSPVVRQLPEKRPWGAI